MRSDRLYLSDSYVREFDASVIETAPSACVLSRTAFHPGGGGQPPDSGSIRWNGEAVPVSGVREDEQGTLWHEIGRELPVGAPSTARSTGRGATRSCATTACSTS